jgi:glyoxylase-like metal-dependent hydrolase (beta-lactamase superfamily II)
MIALAGGVSYIDLEFSGIQRIIATAVLIGPGGVALLDPGPSSTLPTLRGALDRAGITLADVNAIVLSHIHLDHGGAAGTLVRENPAIRVYVHERGAAHMVDPTKLVASAARLYGDAMDRLWGEIRAVPAANLVALRDGDRFAVAGRDLQVAHTPGHAVHHISCFDVASGIAFVGDTAGIRLHPHGPIVPPTPPPDIDLEAWRTSLARIGAWHADTLFLTHFGSSSSPSAHLAETAERLEWMASTARTSLAREGSDEDRERWFIDQVRIALLQTMNGNGLTAIETAGRLDLNWKGLARYWRRR